MHLVFNIQQARAFSCFFQFFDTDYLYFAVAYIITQMKEQNIAIITS